MEFVSDSDRRLETLADWRDHAGGDSPKAWAEGGGARELATAWLEGDAADRAAGLLETVPELAGLVLERGVAEKVTYFDDIPGEPRQHDLLVFARSPDGPTGCGPRPPRTAR
jgi:hypothetical protein